MGKATKMNNSPFCVENASKATWRKTSVEKGDN
jgi:hypothetical protein